MLFLAFFGPPILRCLVSYELRWEFLLLSGARDCLLFELPGGAKRYRDLVRAVPSARFAYPIPIGSPASAVDVISIETTVVQHRRDQHAVAIDVDVSRGGPIPEEVHPLQAVHFVTTRVQRDLPRCRCRCRSRCCSRCRCGRGGRGGARCGGGGGVGGGGGGVGVVGGVGVGQVVSAMLTLSTRQPACVTEVS